MADDVRHEIRLANIRKIGVMDNHSQSQNTTWLSFIGLLEFRFTL
jgi:hypothetical protein